MEFILICHHVLFIVLLMHSISLHISRGSAGASEIDCEKSFPVIDPPKLIVGINEPNVSAICKPSQSCIVDCVVKWEIRDGTETKSGNSSVWKMDIMNVWDADPVCHVMGECDIRLEVIVYKPPDSVSISYVDHNGPELEAQQQYSLQCHVQDVALVGNLTVTFYRGQEPLAPPQISSVTRRKPANHTFSVYNVNISIEDDGAVYWCEAKLDLGPDGPQPLPVVNSNHLKATVYYKPQREVLRQDITITAGDHLHLDCSAKSNPSADYIWTSPPAVSNNLNMTSCCPTVYHITSDHGGEYKCFASNIKGNITVFFHVTVKVDLLPIVAGLAAVGVVVLMVVFGIVYSSHYRRTHTGHYTLRDMFHFRKSNHNVL